MIRILIAELFLAAYRGFHLIHAGAQVLFEGFWMGLLPESVYDEISERSYGAGAEYTGRQYLDSGLQFWEELIVKRYFPPGARVLIGSAGGGREMIAMVRLGYSVDGFECSRNMVEAGRKALAERSLECRLDWAPPSRVPDIQGVYDAAIVGWNGYTYIAPRDRRVAFLVELGAGLTEGAPVLISGAIGSGRSGIWIPRVANAVRRLTLRKPVFERGDAFPTRPRHSFTKKQWEGEVREAGYQPAAFFRWGNFGAIVCHKGTGPTRGAA